MSLGLSLCCPAWQRAGKRDGAHEALQDDYYCEEEAALQGTGFNSHLLGTETESVWFNQGKNNSVFFAEGESDGKGETASHWETIG